MLFVGRNSGVCVCLSVCIYAKMSSFEVLLGLCHWLQSYHCIHLSLAEDVLSDVVSVWLAGSVLLCVIVTGQCLKLCDDTVLSFWLASGVACLCDRFSVVSQSGLVCVAGSCCACDIYWDCDKHIVCPRYQPRYDISDVIFKHVYWYIIGCKHPWLLDITK